MYVEIPHSLGDEPGCRPLHLAVYFVVAGLAHGEEEPVEVDDRFLERLGVRRTPRNRGVNQALAWLVVRGYLRHSGNGYDVVDRE